VFILLPLVEILFAEILEALRQLDVFQCYRSHEALKDLNMKAKNIACDVGE
jgi:hypothetical protein